jgi:hypothetical protein
MTPVRSVRIGSCWQRCVSRSEVLFGSGALRSRAENEDGDIASPPSTQFVPDRRGVRTLEAGNVVLFELNKNGVESAVAFGNPSFTVVMT